ncbi:hypothetical protein ACJMK2_028109 [Sinanodonta woodiana]|uniref:Vitelline membrane outer layer protein 1 homolog n=1 Tax=Sinanodonta woodiana TaxID=1069815 RepID=A0ABD3X9M5_SINWO
MLHTLIYILSLTITIRSLSLLQIVPRNVVRTLTVDNGAQWGDWHFPDFCAEGSFAVGYNQKIEPNQHSGDDTSLNAILLQCESVNGSLFGGQVRSGEGSYGDWTGWSGCNKQAGTHDFLTSFSLQVEPKQGDIHDDTAANYVKFMCRDFKSDIHQYELVYPPGHGNWGEYGGWSESCPVNSAICGIQTRVEEPQCDKDDTSLNDVKFFCC